MIAIGAGGLDVAAAMAGVPFTLKMPKIVNVILTGKLPDYVTAKDVILEVFDLQGRRIVTLVNGLQSAGIQRVSFDASRLVPGSYVYRLSGEDFNHTAKLVVLR